MNNEITEELIIQAEAGDEKAKLEIIESLRPCFNKFYKYIDKEWWDDCKQQAVVGVLIAIDKFDMKRGSPSIFRSFALQFVKGEIRELERTCIAAAVKVPQAAYLALIDNYRKKEPKRSVILKNGMKINFDDIERFKNCLSLSEIDSDVV